MCTNTVNFGSVTPEIDVWEICTFETIRQKSAYLTEYLNKYWTDFHQRFSFGRGMYAHIKLTYFSVVHGTLLWPINFGGFLNWPFLLFALVFWNEMHHPFAGVCINSSTNCYLWCKKMVKIGSVVFELKCVARKSKLCCDLAEIWRILFIWHSGILKRIGILQF